MALHRHVSKPDGSSPNDYHDFTCGHCGQRVSGATIARNANGPLRLWLLCQSCMKGSVRIDNSYFPSVMFGPTLDGLPDDVADAYDEARRCMSVSAFTGAELLCRKILMHVAVDKEADEGKSFAFYLSFLEKEGYITPSIKEWADLIRQHGNHATHKLETPSKEQAEDTIMFTAQLLRIVYEMEYLKNKYTTADAKQS